MANFDMDWGSIAAPGTGSGVDYVKFTPGTKQILRIVGKPSKIESHWEKDAMGKSKRVICLGVECPICKVGQVPTSRYQVLVIDRADKKVKILEGGSQIFNAIKGYAMDSEYGNPMQYDIRITREGAGRETKYTVIPSPNKSDVTDEEKELIKNSKSIEDLNKPKTVDEIMGLGLVCLADNDDFNVSAPSKSSELSDSDWGEL